MRGPVLRLLVAFGCVSWPALSGELSGARERTDVARTVVVDWLRRQESLVHSAECRYEVTRQPTSDEMIPLVKELCTRRGQDPAGNIVTEEDAKTKSHAVRWYRQGVKERQETSRADSKVRSVVRTDTFDGQFVGTVNRSRDGAIMGTLKSVEQGHWQAHMAQPFSFLHEFVHQRPYSEVVQQASEFRSELLTDAGDRRLQVSLRDVGGGMSWELFFDDEFRLLRRELRINREGEANSVQEIHEFSDYGPYSHESGETIWYPHMADYRFYMGKLDGTPVQWTGQTYRINEIQFNVELPDGLFSFTPPRHGQFNDRVTGLQVINSQDRVSTTARNPSTARSASSTAWTTRWRFVVSALPLLLIIGVLLAMASQRRRARRVAHGNEPAA